MWMWTQILVRSRVDPRSIIHSVKQQIVAVNPDQQATLWDDGVLESWIQNQPVFAQGTSRFRPLRRVFCPRA